MHHIAFAVPDRAAQLEVRKRLVDTGYQVTPVIDRDYFWSIYFRTPGGVLFEVATNEPGFDRDEDTAHLGKALKLPTSTPTCAAGWKRTWSRSHERRNGILAYHAEGRAERRPLVFVFHSTGGTEAQFVPLVRELCQAPPSWRRAATSASTARCASSAGKARVATTWRTLRRAPRR